MGSSSISPIFRELKAGEEKLRTAYAYTNAVIGSIHEPLVVLDRELRIEAASESFYSFFGGSPEGSLGRSLLGVDAYHLDTPALRAFLDRKEECKRQRQELRGHD